MSRQLRSNFGTAFVSPLALAAALSIAAPQAGWSQEASPLRGPLPAATDAITTGTTAASNATDDSELLGADLGDDTAEATRPATLKTQRDTLDAAALEREGDAAAAEAAQEARRRRQLPAPDRQLATGTVPAKSIDAADFERNTAARPTAERAIAIETLNRRPEANPYQAPGIRAGTFILRPTLDQGAEWTSNATNTAGGGSDYVSETKASLEAASDWARHSAALSATGTYRTSLTGSGYSEFKGAAKGALRLDLGSEFALNAAAGYERAPEDASSPVAIVGAVGKPIRERLTGSLGLEKNMGKLRLGATGSLTRDTYGDALLASGGTLSQSDRNQTLYALALRGGYEISPALTPFLEAEIGRRAYDNAVDAAGYRRSAGRYGMRAGLSFDFGEKLNGEVAAGWATEKPDDARLGAVSGLSAAGNVNWSPVRGTTVTLAGDTQFEGSTVPGQSGSIRYSSSLAIARELRANLTGTATLGADWRRYAGSADRDFTWSAETSLTWWFNRYAGLKARARHEETSSTIAGRSSQSTSLYLGVTLRR